MSEDWLGPSFGAGLRRARLSAKLTQTDLATAAELSRASIVNVEQGRQGVSIATLYRLAQALGRDPGELLPDPPDETRRLVIGPNTSASTNDVAAVVRRAKESRGQP